MATVVTRYQLDVTGISSNNLVLNEPHTLNTRPTRVVIPTYGPFYAASVVVRDSSGTRLTRGADFQCAELLQEATLKYGKEISQIILIHATTTTDITIDYQVLGGLYSFDMSAVSNMYETAMLDHRPVDWVNILNKPFDYPPSMHNHMLEDVYGFEYIVVALERLRNSITLSNIPAFEALVDWVKSRTLDVVSYAEIDARTPVKKVVTFDKLLYFMDTLDLDAFAISIIPETIDALPGQLLQVETKANFIPPKVSLYWSIEHITTDERDFTRLNGKVLSSDVNGKFEVPLSYVGLKPYEVNAFKIQIRRNSVIGRVLGTSAPIYIRMPVPEIVDFMNACCVESPSIDVTPESLYILKG